MMVLVSRTAISTDNIPFLVLSPPPANSPSTAAVSCSPVSYSRDCHLVVGNIHQTPKVGFCSLEQSHAALTLGKEGLAAGRRRLQMRGEVWTLAAKLPEGLSCPFHLQHLQE